MKRFCPLLLALPLIVLSSACHRKDPPDDTPTIPALELIDLAIPSAATSAAAREVLATYAALTDVPRNLFRPPAHVRPTVVNTEGGKRWTWQYGQRGLTLELTATRDNEIYYWVLRATGTDTATGLTYRDDIALEMTVNNLEAIAGQGNVYQPGVSGVLLSIHFFAPGSAITYSAESPSETSGKYTVFLQTNGAGSLDYRFGGFVSLYATYYESGRGEMWRYNASGYLSSHTCWNAAGAETDC
ncbi:MAG: hypothetical protein HYV63_09165 [Candidatus Schekmanbacteria bacterium]|nr:hypothetical protein [Candidatus Schekmanbacteria bacterium]